MSISRPVHMPSSTPRRRRQRRTSKLRRRPGNLGAVHLRHGMQTLVRRCWSLLLTVVRGVEAPLAAAQGAHRRVIAGCTPVPRESAREPRHSLRHGPLVMMMMIRSPTWRTWHTASLVVGVHDAIALEWRAREAVGVCRKCEQARPCETTRRREALYLGTDLVRISPVFHSALPGLAWPVAGSSSYRTSCSSRTALFPLLTRPRRSRWRCQRRHLLTTTTCA